MELYQLASFVAVAEEGNMTRAAARLNVSQPAVSAQIKALEEELGITLFQRTSKGMELTGEGERLKEKAGGVLRGMADFRNEAERIVGGGHGVITLGANTDPRLLRLKEVHSLLSRRYPGLSLVVKETMSWDVVSELRSGGIDLGFSYFLPEDDGVEARLLGEIELAVVAPEAWREALADADAGKIAEFPWVWTSDHCPMNRVLTALFADIGARPKKTVVVDQESAILKFVADEVGLGVMPLSKANEVASAYGIAPVMLLEKRLSLYLLSLGKRDGEMNLTAMKDVIGEVWT
ncbi:LysR family transcriptional regulator [Pseudodesulfovibrio cashew]|uniref:LysR family transcriptional regulator n=1 Tax=Pseudodesulfovibrio cashew TaxID=2678688 RepID=A0A6I6JLF7_9BACT|nr:LysR family transcriptional regulator [Pseudodesulfovibrio cashew]QGY41830.1 LysR family transcriptional regulator [Pseudodesulfovibrio cashew]